MGAIAELPDKHAALYLLRYQIGRMDYLIRTTPASMCEAALVRFDADIRCSYQAIVARVLTEVQWEHACLPTRDGGLGLRSVRGSADAAYYSSRAATWERCEAIYSGYAGLMDDPVRQVEANINSQLDLRVLNKVHVHTNWCKTVPIEELFFQKIDG